MRNTFKSCECIFAILLLSPIEKEQGPSFEQTRTPFTIMLYAKFG